MQVSVPTACTLIKGETVGQDQSRAEIIPEYNLLLMAEYGSHYAHIAGHYLFKLVYAETFIHYMGIRFFSWTETDRWHPGSSHAVSGIRAKAVGGELRVEP
jgi:hypothetical protein